LTELRLLAPVRVLHGCDCLRQGSRLTSTRDGAGRIRPT
jgi:hypothetical protein